jgi:hypothetical protein
MQPRTLQEYRTGYTSFTDTNERIEKYIERSYHLSFVPKFWKLALLPTCDRIMKPAVLGPLEETNLHSDIYIYIYIWRYPSKGYLCED